MSPTKAYRSLTAWAGVVVLVAAVGLHVGIIFAVAELQPAFLKRIVPTSISSSSAPYRSETLSELRARARRFASDRSRRLLEDSVALWAFSTALLLLLQKSGRTRDAPVAITLVALILAARHFATLRVSSWPDTTLLLLLAIAAGGYLAWRGYPALDGLNAVSLALIVITLGFFVRQMTAVLIGRNVDRATLGVLGWWNPVAEQLLGRIDLFTLWWSLVLAAAVAVWTGRSYPVTATVIAGINAVLLLAGWPLVGV